MNTPEKFLVHCKQTCFGGSEKGTCECKGPNDCKLRSHPKFSHYQKQAEERTMRHFRNALEQVGKIDEEE